MFIRKYLILILIEVCVLDLIEATSEENRDRKGKRITEIETVTRKNQQIAGQSKNILRKFTGSHGIEYCIGKLSSRNYEDALQFMSKYIPIDAPTMLAFGM